MTMRKQGAIYDKWHRRVEGQIRDTMHAHPEYFNFANEAHKKWLINSLAKRIVGEIVAEIKMATVVECVVPTLHAPPEKDDGHFCHPAGIG